MLGLKKLIERFKGTQVHALNPPGSNGVNTTGSSSTPGNCRVKFKGSKQKSSKACSGSGAETLIPFGFPRTDHLEPSIEPHLKPIQLIETLADLFRRSEACLESEKSLIYIEQYSILSSLGDPKLLRRCLRAARQHALDVHSKVVLSAWLRYERREDELEGVSPMDCSSRFILECPKATLVYGYDPNSIYDNCKCYQECAKSTDSHISKVKTLEEDSDVSFCVGNEEIDCIRFKIAALSRPLKAMLYGSFKESKSCKIDFSHTGISVEGMRAVDLYSRTRRVDLFHPEVVLELLSFANRFCCEEMKSDCDIHLASLVSCIEDALILIEYGLEERANFLVASCLQLLLRELPTSLYNPKVMKMFCSFEAKERLASAGHASFILYYFLSQVSMEVNTVSNVTVMLLERLRECAAQKWQKALALHQLGCVLLERQEYTSAQCCFEAAAEASHVYSLAGNARCRFKQGQRYSAYKLMSLVIAEYKAVGWMYQERSLYNVGKDKIDDLNTATELDPTLVFPYKYRAVLKAEEKQTTPAILEIDRIIGFKLEPDCLELRAWFFIAIEDYGSALRDVQALFTLDPNYRMFDEHVSGDNLIEFLSLKVEQGSQADCWMQLYDRWSCLDDIGSLAVIHQMLVNDPGKSLLRFRQFLLLLRLNCQKAAMRCLRLARNLSSSEHKKLVYEGWILHDTGHREEAIARADESISIQRSFEAFFLKAYILADTSLGPESSYVIQLLEEAIRCPSDGLRKGQALNNLGSIYVDCGKLDEATNCYMNALEIKHTRAHQGLARIHFLRNKRKAAYDEMSKLIEKACSNASIYEKRSEYCDGSMAKNDLNMATRLDPLRTYPYRYRAAVLMDEQKDSEAIKEVSKAIAFKPDQQMLHLRAAFYESIGDLKSAVCDCEAALCLEPNHIDTLDLYNKARGK
ncbi:Ethylene-overproduction 1 -like protein [Gossypium arboreum]|uniref:Ethylene-overproduction 1-like protein n=1 Tax=Gossypium arboreum TaxID=29729 RepID=A0A0B0N1Z8_GOSAR|nr:ethylene-overproduction protein 1-like [Gossypium arboreum]KHG05206.1 Ethylene-overproduction 1 -like protein [Gossypium arboreum]